ncbi:oligosaccharyl transferase STT3 subunit, putative [Babesia bigemina]|uniref:dolichyl-diphosphooligosaccharide--protein glycotransferase n=1 Tax=Babesia bigemina TaxID=5866 RepID=A0A061DD91_BABBI|nr:oligosaccharyl transferase STT3 subunit, putative [Babesia bigemina]CDR96065.1 oligosaccharyl transferase STT3 subunit, putative [Babesia bigemina]|eukprot:XP_012768251.1 oligosaccharyl transferase STT3 subunit, putative [Babesia bigemina]
MSEDRRSRIAPPWATDSRTLLALIALQGFLLRLFSAVKHEVVLHEYDPYFNYQCAKFMLRHGLRNFWKSFDDGSWYPFGRAVGQTVYPGLMLAAYAAHQALQYIGVDVDLKTVCVFLPAVLSAGTVYAVYLLAKEISHNECVAVTSAFFVGPMPALVSRTTAGTQPADQHNSRTAGAFDNEAVAIMLMVMSLYAWLRAVRDASIARSAGAAVTTFLMALSWGGYVFVVNAIAAFTLAAVLLRASAESVCAVYIVYHALTVALCFSVPMISNAVLGTMEMRLPHIVFSLAITTLSVSYTTKRWLRCRPANVGNGEQPPATNRGEGTHGAKEAVDGVESANERARFNWAIALGPAAAAVWLILVGRYHESESSLTARLLALLKPGNATSANPLVASISEHQPTKWKSMVLDFWVTLIYNPIGLLACFKNGIEIGYLALAIYGVVSSYFASAMVRLGLIFAPAAAILSGLGLSYTMEGCALNRKNRAASVALTVVTGVIMMSYVTHCTWVASTIYSNPNVVASWRSQNGERLVADDFRDAYSWIRHNTPRDAVVMAWWDYGYQLRQMANRTVLTDNNTSNYHQIALTAMIFASEEEHAHRMLRDLNVHYVMVVYGGVAKYATDDVSKFGWMTRIASTEFPQVHHSRFKGEQGEKYWRRTLLYKLCYHGVLQVAANDNVRGKPLPNEPIELTHFTEVMTSENWVVRVYRVNGEVEQDSGF